MLGQVKRLVLFESLKRRAIIVDYSRLPKDHVEDVDIAFKEVSEFGVVFAHGRH